MEKKEKEKLIFKYGHNFWYLDKEQVIRMSSTWELDTEKWRCFYSMDLDSINKKMLEVFADQGFLFKKEYLCSLALKKAIGYRMEDIPHIFEQYEREKESRRESDFSRQQRWSGADKLIREYTCGLTNEKERYENGFLFHLLLKSSYSYEEQLAFARKAKKEIKKYVYEEIRGRRSFLRSVKNLDYYYISRMFLTKRNELDIFLELKPGITKQLEEYTNQMEETHEKRT